MCDRSRFAAVVPQPTSSGQEEVQDLGVKAAALAAEYVAAMEAQRLKDGLRAAIRLSAAGNLFFQVGGDALRTHTGTHRVPCV